MRSIIGSIMVIIMLSISSLSLAYDERPLFNLAQKQIDISGYHYVPIVHYVSYNRLLEVYKELFTLADVDKIENIEGLYDSGNNEIYILDTLPDSDLERVLIHEFLHFFQDIRDGEIETYNEHEAKAEIQRRENEVGSILLKLKKEGRL